MTLSKMQSVRFASGAAIGYSPIPWPVPTRAPGSTRLSSVPRRTGSSPTPTCAMCSPSCPRRNRSPRSKPCYRPVSTPPPWRQTHSKGRSPPHVNNALCGALTKQLLKQSRKWREADAIGENVGAWTIERGKAQKRARCSRHVLAGNDGRSRRRSGYLSGRSWWRRGCSH